MTPAIWLDHMTVKKTPWDKIPKEDQLTYLPFIINLWLSHAVGYIEFVNEVQKYQVPNRDHYNFYLKILPKKKLFLNWVKPKSKKYNKDIISKISTFYKVSTREINESLDCLEEPDLFYILENMGLNEKDIKKLMK